MILENVLDKEDSSVSYTDAGWWLLDNGNHPNESDEDREKRLDLLCRDVLDGKVNEDNLSDDEWIAVKLRVRENTQKRLQDFLQREQKVME